MGRIAKLQDVPPLKIKHPPRGKTTFDPYRITSRDRLTEVIELASRGARPAIIHHLTGIPQNQAAKMYKEATGKNPPHGIIPTCTSKSLCSPPFRIEASMFMKYHQKFIADGLSLSQAIVWSFDMYSDFYKSQGRLCINRCYNLINQVDNKLVVIEGCKACNCSYVVLSDQILSSKDRCPFCYSLHMHKLNAPHRHG